jgi:hypothetical protein
VPWVQYVKEEYDIYIPEYNAENNPVYICNAKPGAKTSEASWQIYKLSYDNKNNLIKRRYANGKDSFDKIANNYSNYNYIDI